MFKDVLLKPPGNLIIAGFALESIALLAAREGHPITRRTAEDWLRKADADPACIANWIKWRLDNISDLVEDPWRRMLPGEITEKNDEFYNLFKWKPTKRIYYRVMEGENYRTRRPPVDRLVEVEAKRDEVITHNGETLTKGNLSREELNELLADITTAIHKFIL